MQEKETAESLQLRIRALEKEVKQLHSQIKNQRYGLVWLDVPEAFDQESENKIPILEEVKDKAIHTPDGKPTHILIEGDNYHALTCLNYTHRGKIDVIYIDPPYNTGKDGFTYKDKRFLKEYPNGQPIKKEHPLRHSTWLSFIGKRLKLAKNLLSERGVIFISIDDNEQAQLKLLCDEIFGEKNFIGLLPRITKKSGKDHSDNFAKNHDFLLAYARSIDFVKFGGIIVEQKGYNCEDEYVEIRGKYKLNQTLDYDSLWYNPAMDFPLEINGKIFYPGGDEDAHYDRHRGIHNPKDWVWRWSLKKFHFGYTNGFVVIKRSKKGVRIYTKTYLNASIVRSGDGYKIKYLDRKSNLSSLVFVDNEFSNDNAKKQMAEVIDGNVFDFPKPTSLIQTLLSQLEKDVIILDFFAGSGTTLHATMQLNEEDGGNRQCILVQQQEEKRICETITYVRNKRVMQGYINPKGEEIPGLGNSLKYYRTTFVGENPAQEASDTDKTLFAQKAGCLLALGENTLDEIKRNEHYQLFSDGKRLTAVYFTEDARWLDDFVAELEQWHSEHKGAVCAYIFSWSDGEEYISMLEHLPRTEIKSIPQPILEIYKKLYS